MAQSLRRNTGIAALLLLAVAAAAGLFWLAAKPDFQPTPPSPPAAATAGIPPPQFDVVRVDAGGNTVIAGRAAPGATVTILRGDRVLGTAQADTSGAFAFIPGQPLPPGAQELSLTEEMPNGAVIKGLAIASVNVPRQSTGTALTVISGAGGSQVQSAQAPAPGTLALGTVDYDADGHAIFSGTAPAGAKVALSLNGGGIGRATAGRDGRWRLVAKVPAANGTLSLAATDAKGGALPGVSAPFALETLPTAVADGHVIIAPGQNLWLIARHVYGQGNLYTLIYDANSKAIRDPNLIFPGQGFAMPRH